MLDKRRANMENRPNGQANGGNPLAALSQKLNLTPAQQEQVKPVLAESQKAMESIKSMPRGPEKKDAMMAMVQTMDDKMKLILSTDQFKQWQQMRAERMEQGQRGGMR
jgi:hypothetical protein